MLKITKILITLIFTVFLITSYSNIAMASDHPAWQEIKKIRKEIITLGAEPTKRKGLQGDSKLLKILQKQLDELKEDLKKEEEKQKKIEVVKQKIIKEIEALGEKPEEDTSDIDSDKEIIALKKQLQDIKDRNKKKKEDDDRIAKEKKAREKKEQQRAKAIETIKQELIFLGAKPISEYEFSNNDEYISALRKQIETIKLKNEEEEAKLKDSIPEWYATANMPKNSDTIVYAKGTHTSADIDQSELIGLEKAKAKLASNLESTMSLKIEIATNEKVVDVDSAFKSEISSISKSVAQKVSIGGYKTYKSETVALSNGKFRNFIIIEFPVTLAYKVLLKDIENNPATKNVISKIKNTEAFKELERLVDEYTGA